MLAKLAAGATGYDLIVPTGNAMDTLIRQGALKPAGQIAAAQSQKHQSRISRYAFDPGNKYSVPYAYTITLIGFNQEKIKELGLPTDTWAIIFEPKYLEK